MRGCGSLLHPLPAPTRALRMQVPMSALRSVLQSRPCTCERIAYHLLRSRDARPVRYNTPSTHTFLAFPLPPVTVDPVSAKPLLPRRQSPTPQTPFSRTRVEYATIHLRSQAFDTPAPLRAHGIQ